MGGSAVLQQISGPWRNTVTKRQLQLQVFPRERKREKNLLTVNEEHLQDHILSTPVRSERADINHSSAPLGWPMTVRCHMSQGLTQPPWEQPAMEIILDKVYKKGYGG